jgi:predicted DNA-binding transcriptional regulator AlpA
MAQALGIGRNVAYELAQRADFPAVRIGERRIVVPIERLKNWLDQQAGWTEGGEIAHRER